MRTPTRLALAVIATLSATALWAQPASANTTQRSVFQVDDTFIDKETCDFRLHFTFFGSITISDYYDNSGFLYKEIQKGRPGPFTVTVTAKGTTLTQQNVSYNTQLTFNPDGSLKTITDNGPYNKLTVPGGGVVLLDTGHIVFDSDFNIVFESGPRQATHGDFDAFCAAFG
jgi:hypothetical protein